MNYKKVRTDSQIDLPREGDCGIDLRCIDDVVIGPGDTKTVFTGIAVEIPSGYFGKILDRSSVAKNSVIVLGGVIDSSYRGEIIVLLHNLSDADRHFGVGDKIAQMVIVPYVMPSGLNCVDDLSPTDRGGAGFGSTGK